MAELPTTVLITHFDFQIGSEIQNSVEGMLQVCNLNQFSSSSRFQVSSLSLCSPGPVKASAFVCDLHTDNVTLEFSEDQCVQSRCICFRNFMCSFPTSLKAR